jgi:hypothetical protein
VITIKVIIVPDPNVLKIAIRFMSWHHLTKGKLAFLSAGSQRSENESRRVRNVPIDRGQTLDNPRLPAMYCDAFDLEVPQISEVTKDPSLCIVAASVEPQSSSRDLREPFACALLAFAMVIAHCYSAAKSASIDESGYLLT